MKLILAFELLTVSIYGGMDVKKIISIFLSLFMAFGISSCSQNKAQLPQDESKQEQGDVKADEEKLDKEEARKILDEYLRALILRDNEKINTFYSEKLKQQAGSFTPTSDSHPNGFKIDTVEEKEGKLEGKATLLSVYTGKPYFSSDESKYTIIKEKGTYVIDKIEKSKSSEIVEKEKALFLKEKGDVKGKEIIKIDQLAGYMVPQGATPDRKYTIGTDGFGPIAGDVEGKKFAVSTVGTYPAVMIFDSKGKKVNDLDLYFQNTVQSLSWSQDGSYIMVEVTNPAGSRSVYIYDAEKGKKVDDSMKNIMKPDKYSINTPYWISENELVFNVSAMPGLTPDEEKNLGSYKFDAKNETLTRY